MKRIPVTSSMVRSVGYDQSTQMLELQFTSGHIYRYAGVPEDVHRDLMEAESKGHFVRDHILEMYVDWKVK